MAKPIIIWFKRDLRISDNAAVFAAAQKNLPVIPLFIIEPDYWKLPDVSRRHWHFIHDSLVDLKDELILAGAPLVVRCGEAVEVLADLKKNYNFSEIFSNQETGNLWTFNRDKKVKKWCLRNQILWHEFASNAVVRKLASRDSWAQNRNAIMQQKLLPSPQKLAAISEINLGEILAKDDDFFGEKNIGNVQKGGRIASLKVLESFLQKRASNYIATLSKPGVSARNCSRLSAGIAYGCLSVREIEQATKKRIEQLKAEIDQKNSQLVRNLRAFLSRLAWRCHFVQKLEQQFQIEFSCMHAAFEGMRENDFNPLCFQAWCDGKTGYPLVDAAMRSLHENGWITFRMRAMLVSFASYHLWLDWRKTAPFLARLFTDYEPGIHYSQFQMQSGTTGINAVRIYNPVKQSYDHDLKGDFIRRFVPELAQVGDNFIHEPWRMDLPPENYPKPIVENELAMKIARQKIREIWQKSGFKNTAQQVVNKLGSRKKSTRNIAKKKLNFAKKDSAKQLSFGF